MMVVVVVPGLAEIPYEERLRKMDLPSLGYRRTQRDATEFTEMIAQTYFHCMNHPA